MNSPTSHRVWLVFSFSLALAGCGAQGAAVDDGDSTATDDIVGGQVVRGIPAVGMLVNFTPDGNNSDVCTGTLIGSRTVLTAAHCVMALDNGGRLRPARAQASNLVFYTGSNIKTFESDKVFAVSEVLLPGGDAVFPLADFVAGVARGAVTPWDLALVHLVRSPPVKPMPIARSAPRAGQKVTMVGYGSVKVHGGAGVGTKRAVATPISGGISDFLFEAGTAQKGTCSGDSGGPAIRDGQVLGVTQAGSVNDADVCIGNDVFTRADSFAAFILPNVL